MTASSTNGWGPNGTSTQLPPGATLPLTGDGSTVVGGQGQILVYNASGDMQAASGSVPGLIPAGRVMDKLTPIGASDGAAAARMFLGFGSGDPASTIANDSFTKADTCTPCFAKDASTIGKLSNYSGSVRPLVGLVSGVDDMGNPYSWVGPIAHAVARGVLMANAFPLATTEIADALASTAISEKAIERPKVKGVVTSIQLTGAAIAADNTDYITVTVSKRDGAGGAAVVLGTYDSRAANNGAVTAFVPASFTLSVVAGALYLLETDIVTITTVKGGAGKVITGAILVNGKAL